MLTISITPDSDAALNDLPEPEPAPTMYIKILHHPHSGLKEPGIVPLQGDHIRAVEDRPSVPQAMLKPWAPFRSRSDFEYTETAVQGLLNEDVVNKQLYGLHNGWAEKSCITLRSYVDMERSLAAARQCGIGASLYFCLLGC